jgi:hypothetical protein
MDRHIVSRTLSTVAETRRLNILCRLVAYEYVSREARSSLALEKRTDTNTTLGTE